MLSHYIAKWFLPWWCIFIYWESFIKRLRYWNDTALIEITWENQELNSVVGQPLPVNEDDQIQSSTYIINWQDVNLSNAFFEIGGVGVVFPLVLHLSSSSPASSNHSAGRLTQQPVAPAFWNLSTPETLHVDGSRFFLLPSLVDSSAGRPGEMNATLFRGGFGEVSGKKKSFVCSEPDRIRIPS